MKAHISTISRLDSAQNSNVRIDSAISARHHRLPILGSATYNQLITLMPGVARRAYIRESMQSQSDSLNSSI